MSSRRTSVGPWVAVAFVSIAVVLFSLGPDPFPDLDGGIAAAAMERLPHLLAYAALTAVILLAWPQRSWSAVVLVGLALVALGGILELGQVLVGRDADPIDALADAVGVGLVMGIQVAIDRHRSPASRTDGRVAGRVSLRRHARVDASPTEDRPTGEGDPTPRRRS